MRSGSGSCGIARRRTHLARSIRHYLGAKPDGSCAGSSSNHVPKQASWLNMVEIGAGSAHRDPGTARRCNASGARINWMSTTAEAEVKLGGLP